MRKLTGAKHITYEVLDRLTGNESEPVPVSANKVLLMTGYRNRNTIHHALNWLVEHGYVRRTGTGNGSPYLYQIVRR